MYRIRWNSVLATLCAVATSFAISAQGGIIAHWTFDERAGKIVRSATGEFSGELSQQGAEFVPNGISGGAVSLDQLRQGVVNMGPILSLTNTSFTLVSWVRPQPGSYRPNQLVMGKHRAFSENGYFVVVNQSSIYGAPGKAMFFEGTNAAMAPVSQTFIPDGAWHQIAAVYEKGGNRSIFVDGSPVEASSFGSPVLTNTAPFLIGGYAEGEDTIHPSFTGLIDDIQVYDRALSPEEIDVMFNNPGAEIQGPNVPQILPRGGYFTQGVSVQIVNPNSGEDLPIRYTLNGNEPTERSSLYTGPFQVTNSVVLKAATFQPNGSVQAKSDPASFWRIYAVDDGIPNEWRERYFGKDFLVDPRVAATADPDGDGAPNIDEFVAGTDPLDPADGVSIRLVPEIRWLSTPGTTYRILRKRSFSDESWTVVRDDFEATTTVSRFVDDDANPHSFYSIEPVQ